MVRLHRRMLLGAGLALLPAARWAAGAKPLDAYDVRQHGAAGNGAALDTAAIQRTIDAASAGGGGTVYFPPGRYLSFSVQLRSRVTLQFASGAVLVAADPKKHAGRYEAPEPNASDVYQDFGHNHWRNSLLWGDGVQDIAIVGPGLIDGAGLTSISPNAGWTVGIGRNLPPSAELDARIADHEAGVKAMDGQGNKAIALKNARNVTLRDFSILRGGHFAILLTGVDNIVIDGLTIDTNRDGIDLDVVRNAHLSNLSVNSPTDDAIVLKSSLALGVVRPTENVTITNCQVSGYDLGSLLDGTFRKTQLQNIEPHLTSGRIKLGTESNGGYRNIAISNCVFDCCNGLALESVDGGVLEDVTVSNLVMRDATAAPIFIRLGDRRRAPPGTPIAVVRRVSISDIDAVSLDRRYCAIVSGVPGGIVEDISLRGIRLLYPGGGAAGDPARAVPEAADGYPDPDMFGPMPAWGLYMRHVRGAVLRDIELHAMAADPRPPAAVSDVTGLNTEGLLATPGPGQVLQPVQI
ncbi:MAG: glycosyl hydrolase family 28-related protein [Rhizomicrobium sp.]